MSQPQLPLWSRSVAAALALSLGLAACRSEADPDALVAEARHYHGRGETRAAVIQLKNAIGRDASHRAARSLLGEVYIDQGDAVSAEKELRRALALGANIDQTNPLLARALLMQGQYERLLDELQAPAGPGGAVLLALRGDAHLGLGHTAQAQQSYEEALRRKEGCAAALLGLARIALSGKDAEQAHALLERALAADPGELEGLRFKGDLFRFEGKAAQALAAYRKILALRPNNAQALLDVASLHIDAGKFTEARADIAQARKASPTSAAVFHAQALLDYREGKHAAALETLQLVLSSAPEHYPSVLLAGIVHAELGASAQAEQHLLTFLHAYPRHVYASKALASLHLRKQKPEAALVLLQPLLVDMPDEVELLTLCGEALLRSRRYSEAEAHFTRAAALRPQVPMLHTGLALSRLGSGDHDRAVAELERAASLDRHSVQTGVLLAMTYLRARQPDKAQAAIAAMEKQGDNPLVQNLKGGIFLVRGDQAGARASFSRALALDPLYLPALDNLAQLDAMQLRPEDAEPRYLSALARAPNHPGLMEALARLASSHGKDAEALAWMEKAHRAAPDALPTALSLVRHYLRAGQLQKALSLALAQQQGQPASPDALAALAEVQAAQKNFAGALDSIGKLAILLPANPTPQLRLASLYLAQHDEAGAVTALRKALAIDPDHLDARLTLQGILLGQKKFEEAQQLARAAQQRHPQAPAGYKLEGDVHSAQQRHAPALAAYERAFALAPSGPLLLQVHAALQALGRQADADARLALWFRQHPADVPTRLAIASARLAGGDYKGAALHLEAVLKVDADNVLALNDLAWCYWRNGEKRALTLAERAHALAPGSATVMDTLGWLRLETGDVRGALPLLRRASALAPESAEIRYHLGQCLARTGDKRAARQELEKALAAPGEFARRDDARALLSTL
jgi:cellulose synthase operon protein C